MACNAYFSHPLLFLEQIYEGGITSPAVRRAVALRGTSQYLERFPDVVHQRNWCGPKSAS